MKRIIYLSVALFLAQTISANCVADSPKLSPSPSEPGAFIEHLGQRAIKLLGDKTATEQQQRSGFRALLREGFATRAILKTFGYLGLEESYNHPLKKKDQVFRLNKALKELFRIPRRNNPFFWKQNKLLTNITITAYDINNIPVLPPH